jgi:hypothetical protein
MPRLKAGIKGASMRMGVKITSRQAERRMVCGLIGRTQIARFTTGLRTVD